MNKLPEDVLNRVNEGVKDINEDTKYGEIVIGFHGEDSPVSVSITRKAHIHIREQRPARQHYVRQG